MLPTGVVTSVTSSSAAHLKLTIAVLHDNGEAGSLSAAVIGYDNGALQEVCMVCKKM